MATGRSPDRGSGARAVVVMGVCGVGKTTVGRDLAEAIGGAFLEGDDFHPPANVAKMRSGVPLDDADRAPWLAAMAAAIGAHIERGTRVVLACSALKRSYRTTLAGGNPAVRFVFLAGDEAVIRARLDARQGHYMPSGLLDSQLATLETPQPEEDVIALDVAMAPGDIVATALARLEVKDRNE